MHRAYKYRIYPNEAQASQVERTFGCCRFVWNSSLEWHGKRYKEQGLSTSWMDCNNRCNRELKEEFEWLREVDKFALANACRNLGRAFDNFFAGRARYPKFKSKRGSRPAYTTNFTNNNIAVDFDGGRVKLPKLGWVHAKAHRPFAGKILRATVSRTATGKYHVSVVVDTEVAPLPAGAKGTVGVDLGVKSLAVTSEGDVFENPKPLKRLEKVLAREQRRLSRMQKGSHNYGKQRKRVARLHERVADVRRDNAHKVSLQLVRESQAVCMEDLSVKGMLSGHSKAKAVADAGMRQLQEFVRYKCEWHGRDFVKVSRWYPSSQLCSCCGHQNPDVKDLSVRHWDCPVCGAHHDRDRNAAANIKAEGARLLAQAA